MKNQRLTMIVAAALTAFVLVVLGGLTAYLGGALTNERSSGRTNRRRHAARPDG